MIRQVVRFGSAVLVVTLVAGCYPLRAQQPAKPDPTPTSKKADDDVLRISSDLLQIGVSVVNKNGEFITGLRKDDLVLRVDGKPVPAEFFNQVSIGSENAPNDGGKPSTTTVAPVTELPGLGRTLAFVVDDLHLSHESMNRTRLLILKFIDEQMLPGDRVAIVSTGGKVGFLGQFTTDQNVLRAAVARLVYNRISANDASPPPMTEYEAQMIDRLDREVTDVFVDLMLRANPGMHPGMAHSAVISKSKAILTKAATVTNLTLNALQVTSRQAAPFPGRKAIYFISDGFLLDPANNETERHMNRITDAAARSNTVIYSFDAKGLDAELPSGPLVDAANRPPANPGVLRARATPNTAFRIQAANRSESQDGLAFVAENTGGKFVRNTNDIAGSFRKITGEAFTYYLLAWQPQAGGENLAKLRRIDVSVKGRPELTVRVHAGYLDLQPDTRKTSTAKTVSEDRTDEQKLVAAAMSQAPLLGLRAELSTRAYEPQGDGPTWAALVKVDAEGVEFGREGEMAVAALEILALVYNSDGKQERAFRTPLEVRVPSTRLSEVGGRKIDCDYYAKLKPGLYLLRIAVRDTKSGKIGSVSQWFEIPDRGAR